jgi:hypothetical protein
MRGKTAAVREDFGLAKISTTATILPTCRGLSLCGKMALPYKNQPLTEAKGCSGASPE